MKKVPTIVLSVSYKGVKFIDATNKVSPREPEEGFGSTCKSVYPEMTKIRRTVFKYPAEQRATISKMNL